MLFCACNKIITKDHSRVAEYLTYLDKEMALVAQSIGEDRRTVQLHLGGGTPTFFGGDELRALMATIRKYFVFTDDAELGGNRSAHRTRRYLGLLAGVGLQPQQLLA